MHSSPKNLKTKIIPKRFRAWFLASFLLASTALSGFFVFQSALAATGINQQISFQGKVVNSNGTNVTNGSYTFVFQLYTVSSGGTNIWTETKSLTVTDGIFQTELGDTTALPGSVDFNTDNIYLGINFNSDGEMSPRVRFTAAPYAFNAKKVGGLTVTDTTGTLTIPNSETISFGGSFTTSATNDVTLTTTGATNVTLPTTGTLVTLAGTETLTNKTIGSTGLVFSGATTDLTTGTNEDLNLTANGSGDIVIAVDSGTFVNLTGGTDGTGAFTVAAGDVTLSDGDLIVSGGDANFTLDVADTFNVIKSSANAGDVMNITASSVNAIDGLQLDLTATTDAGADNVSGIDIAWTESADADVWTAVNLPNTTTTNSSTRAFVVGTGYDTILDSANLDISGAGVITGATGITSSGTITFSSISGSTQCLHVDSSGVVSGTGSDCGAGGGGSLDAAYTTGNTITTDSGNNVIITLQEVVTPTSFVVENQDTAGVSAERIYNSIASGTLTNGLLVEQTGAGTMTNAIQIAETAGTITDGILVTGTLGNILNTPTLDITGGGAITGATGITSSGTITFSGFTTNGGLLYTNGSGVLAQTAAGTAGQALISGGAGSPTYYAPTAGSVLFAGTSGILEQDNASFFFDNSTNRLGLGTTSPAAQLSIFGTSNALRLSYDVSNYASLSTASDGTLSLTSSNTSESQFVIGTGASVDDSIGFDGASQDYYAGLDHTSGYFTIGTGFTVGSSTLFAIDSTGNIGIGTGVTAPGARLDLSLTSTNTTADTLYAQRNVLSDTGIVTTGTDTTYGVNTSVTRTGATGGTLNTYGNYISVTADNAGAGTSTAYGLYAAVTGADTNYAGIFTGGNVGVGDTTPDNPFEILSTSQQLRLSYTDGSVDGAIYVDSSEYLTLVAGTTSEVNRVQIGAGGAGNATPDLFGLDVKSDTGDPAGGFEGAMYYNTLDNVFRCYQNTGWTNCIGSGGSSDLQTTYATDADGSNATISLTAADDGLIITNPSSSGNDLSAFTLQVSQLNTTAAITTLDLVQASNAANAVDITANSIDTEVGLTVTANALTSGKALTLASSSTAFTGSLANFTLSGSNASNTGSLLAIDNTGTNNTNTSLYIKHYATGTNNLAFRVDDVSGDTTPFVIDGTGAVGIGTTAPTSLFELYGTTAADIVATLTAPDATYDPAMKFRTGASPSVQFTLGVDNSDSDKFKIYSGDGLGSGDEFVIDANGVTTIANLNLGATNFDTDAGIISWVDMPVTASSPDNTVESYTALLDGQNMLSLYALSDGAGSIDTRRVQLGDGGAGVAQPVLLGLDVRSSTGDPTDGFEGAMYYNTVDNVFRCYQNTGWTNCIGAGGSTDLQTAYGNDADGSNVTISLTAADDGLIFTNPTSGGNNLSTFLLQLDQANTTANMLALDIVQASNASNAVNVTANAIDTETGLTITTNGLTSGKAISIASSATAFTGNLADISLTGSNAANTGNVLAVSNTGTANTNTALFVDHRATGTGNLAMRVNDESSDASPFIIDGNGSVGIGTTSIAAYNGVAHTTKLQIGSETNRGDAVVYGDYLRKGYNDLTALANVQSIFIYDTTKDSDAGAWTSSEIATGKSWYTETKDDGPGDACALTDDRCGRSSFPRKAILVATTSAMYIFDAQDGGMWMKFDQDTAGSCVTGPCALGTNTNNDPSSVFAVNGVVYVGTKGSAATGMYAIDFYRDRLQNFDSADRTDGDKNIANRNTVLAYSANAITALSIFSNVVNDVHGAVMYGSSITQTNGGPLNGNLFIAVATDDAAQVINMNSGKVLRYADGATTDDINQVWVTRRGRLYLVNETLQEVERYNDIETSVANDAGPDDIWDEATGNLPNAFKTAPTIATTADAMWVLERETYAESTADTAKADVIYVGHNQGMTEIHDVNAPSGTVIGWSKFYDKDRITPYMSGTPRGMFSFNETTGDLVDSTIRNNVLEPEVAPTYGVNGVFGTGLSFNGSTQFLCSDTNNDGTCDVDTDFDTAAISFHVSLWFKHGTSLSGTDVLVDKRYPTLGGAEGIGYTIEMTSAGLIVFGIQDTAATAAYDDTLTSTLSYADNEWHHLVAVNTDTAICLYIDGRLAVACDTTLAATATLSGNILTVGADGSTASGGNFWEGQIDDLYFAAGGATTSDTLTQAQARRMYNDGMQALRRSSLRVTDATTSSANTIGDSGEAWTLNQFAGGIVEVSGSADTDCNGITRRVTSNTATVLTFTPDVPAACTLDTAADFEIIPEQLYGATNTVTAIAVTDTNFLGKMRERYIATSDGSDGGGLTVMQGYGSGAVTDVFHGDSETFDDGGTEWTGTDYDDVTAIGITEDIVAFGSLAGTWMSHEDQSIDQTIDQLITNIDSIQKELLVDGLLGTSPDTGVLGGADLAERYYSNEVLEAGEVVAMDTSLEAGVRRTQGSYQKNVVGIVATSPGIVLGADAENGYPIALVGRVPVKVTNQNGWPAAGERLTSSTIPGYAMRATQAGRVIGQVLDDPVPGNFSPCPVEYGLGEGALCGTVTVFVNLTDYTGQSVELALAERDAAQGAGLSGSASLDGADQGMGTEGGSVRLATSMPTRQEQILSFLKELRDKQIAESGPSSEVFTGRVSASQDVITPTLYADQIFAKNIKADSIEGLSIWTNQLASLEQKYAGLVAENGAGNEAAVPTTTEKTLLDLERFEVGSLAVSLDATLLGKLSLVGGMTVGGTAQFEGETVFARLASFLEKTVFRGQVAFLTAPSFSEDTAGFAVVEAGANKVRVTFETPYEKQPIVAVTLTNDASPLSEGADEILKQDIELLENEYVQSVFDEDVRYVVTEKSPRGFTIVLARPATRDLQFSWVALAVAKVKSFNSEKVESPKDVPAPEPVVLPLPVTVPVITGDITLDNGVPSSVDAPPVPEGTPAP